MLFVLTAADVTAVGPGTWNEWKAELLTDLYDRAMGALGSDSDPPARAVAIERIREKVLARLPAISPTAESISGSDLAEQLETFPAHYLTSTAPEQIAEDLQHASQIVPPTPWVEGRFDPATATVEYRIVTRDVVGSGLFSRIAGALTAKGLEILSAQICTASSGIVVDSFRVLDRDHSGVIPEFRLREVETAIRDVLCGSRSVESLFRRHTRYGAASRTPLPGAPTRVVIDNTSSERFTIIDVFTEDRSGLLYTIASTLLDLRLSVGLAKISTHLDQVLDVFYVSDESGQKIEDHERLTLVQQTVQKRIEDFDRDGLASALPAVGSTRN